MGPSKSDGSEGQEQKKTKKLVIIDTDPGIDDAMAIFLALNSPELQVVGLTTIFGNVRTNTATSNALMLCERAGRPDIPVAHGEEKTLLGVAKIRVADFVHGDDGMGNTHPPPASSAASAVSAVDFLISAVRERPKEITIIALGPLTNVAKAVQADPNFASNLAELVILGGAFFTNGNVNPAAEANVFGDPEAADVVFTSGAPILAVGINITHQVMLTVDDMEDIRNSGNPHAHFLYDISQFYFSYHKEAYGMDAVYVHDPTVIVAAIDPSLFTFHEGVVRVQLDGITRGLTLLNNTSKRWAKDTPWCNLPAVKVANSVDADAVVKMVKQRLM